LRDLGIFLEDLELDAGDLDLFLGIATMVARAEGIPWGSRQRW
jgi:hypothetical protein